MDAEKLPHYGLDLHRPETPSAPPDDEQFSDEDLDTASSRTNASISDDVICSSCGYTNDGVTTYCVECGRPLDDTSFRSSSSAPKPSMAPGTSATVTPTGTTSTSTSATTTIGGYTWPPLASKAGLLPWVYLASIGFNAVLFLVWLITTDHGLPWFIYPLAGSIILCGCLHLASHHTTDPWLKFHILVSATVNFTLLVTYVFKFTRSPYFAYVLLASIGLLCFHLLLNNHWGMIPRPHKFFYIHLVSIFAPLNLILFTVFLATTPNTAWFVFPLLLTSIPMLSHYIIAFHPDDPHKWFYIDLVTASCLGGLTFMLWAVTPTEHPWFAYLWVALGVIVAAHYVFEYQQESLRRGGETGLKVAQNVWTKAHDLSPSRLAPSSWRKKADNAPPEIVPESGASAAEVRGTPASQV